MLAIDKHTDGYYRLSGSFDRDTVPAFWAQRESWLPKEPMVCLDLAAISRIDSAGMAMLLHLQHQLVKNNQVLQIDNIPAELCMLLRLSNMEQAFARQDVSVDKKETP